jgi:hypothetical protein
MHVDTVTPPVLEACEVGLGRIGIEELVSQVLPSRGLMIGKNFMAGPNEQMGVGLDRPAFEI